MCLNDFHTCLKSCSNVVYIICKCVRIIFICYGKICKCLLYDFQKAFIWCAYEFTWFFKSLIWISCVYMRFMCLYDVHMWLNDFRMFDMMFICCLYNVYMRLYVVLMCVNKCHMLVIWFSYGLVWGYYIVKCFSCICMIFYVYMMIVTCLKKMSCYK